MLPDFHSTEVNASEIKSAIDVYGCCVLRGLVPTRIIEQILEEVQIQYNEMDERFRSGTMSEYEHRHCFRYGIVRPFEQDIRLESGQYLSDVMINIVAETILKDLLQHHFGSEVHLIIPSSHTRRVIPGNGVPYHQDSSVMRLHSTRILNCWFPLDKAGEDSPTLEVFPVAQRSLLAKGLDSKTGLYSHLEITRETITNHLPDTKEWTPTMYPGDVLLLDSYTVHRTHEHPDMKQSRRDFEMRFAAKESICHREDIGQYFLQLNGLNEEEVR